VSLPGRADAVVVGGGVMGASIAYHLTVRGVRDVLLLERAQVCSGPTSRSTAIIRLHYTQPLLVRMAAHGLRTYRAFDDVVGGEAGFVRTGMLFGADPDERAMLEGNVAVGRGEGVETHVVDAEQVAEIDPRVVADDLVYCYEPEAGYCDPYLVTAGFARAAERAGARIAEGVRVVGVEPEAGDDVRRSLDAGERVRIPVPRTIADGQQLDTPGELTWEVIHRRVDAVTVASDAEIVEAMRFLFERVKTVAEPSGACALAALLAGRVDARGHRVGVVISGGNVSADRFASLMA
jgi:FAD dependent oxidoreductase